MATSGLGFPACLCWALWLGVGVMLLSFGVRMVVVEEKSHHNLWELSTCTVVGGYYDDTYLPCPVNCAKQTEHACKYPRCDFRWYFPYWTVTSPNYHGGNRSMAYRCSRTARAFFLDGAASEFCNATLMAATAKAQAASLDAGTLVPCWYNQAQTDLKLTANDETHEKRTWLGTVLVCIGGAPVWCLLYILLGALIRGYCNTKEGKAAAARRSSSRGLGLQPGREERQIFAQRDDEEQGRGSASSFAAGSLASSQQSLLEHEQAGEELSLVTEGTDLTSDAEYEEAEEGESDGDRREDSPSDRQRPKFAE